MTVVKMCSPDCTRSLSSVVANISNKISATGARSPSPKGIDRPVKILSIISTAAVARGEKGSDLISNIIDARDGRVECSRLS